MTIGHTPVQSSASETRPLTLLSEECTIMSMINKVAYIDIFTAYMLVDIGNPYHILTVIPCCVA